MTDTFTTRTIYPFRPIDGTHWTGADDTIWQALNDRTMRRVDVDGDASKRTTAVVLDEHGPLSPLNDFTSTVLHERGPDAVQPMAYPPEPAGHYSRVSDTPGRQAHVSYTRSTPDGAQFMTAIASWHGPLDVDRMQEIKAALPGPDVSILAVTMLDPPDVAR